MRHKTAFTLIELLIVITIIGILAVALLPSVLGAPGRARDAQRKADLKNIVAALESFNSDNGHYPSKGNCIKEVGDGTTATGVLNKYFGGTPPKDPQAMAAGKPIAPGFPDWTTHSAVTCKNDYVYCPFRSGYVVASFVEISGDGNHSTGNGPLLCGGLAGTWESDLSLTLPVTGSAIIDTYLIYRR